MRDETFRTVWRPIALSSAHSDVSIIKIAIKFCTISAEIALRDWWPVLNQIARHWNLSKTVSRIYPPNKLLSMKCRQTAMTKHELCNYSKTIFSIVAVAVVKPTKNADNYIECTEEQSREWIHFDFCCCDASVYDPIIIFSVIMGLVMQRRVQTAPNVAVDDDFNCSRSRNATTALWLRFFFLIATAETASSISSTVRLSEIAQRIINK